MSESVPSPLPREPGPRAGVAMEVFALIADKLVEVESEVLRQLRSEIPPIDTAGQYLAEGRGKRIRPALLLLAAGLLGYRGRHDVTLGAVFEFIHTATLIHDDIIDEAETRRGRPAANRVFGNPLTVLMGDYLYIRAMNMALQARQIRVIDELAAATQRMIEGEILAHDLRGRVDVTPEQHLSIVERKTAALFAGCCRVAAILAEAPPEVEHRLGRFGLDLGIAFQLADDVLDVVADTSTLGKPVASDLREGRMTLPWIDLFARGGDDVRRDIERVMLDGSFDAVGFDALRDALVSEGSIERTRSLARRHAERARRAILEFPRGPFRDALCDIPDLVVSRER